jgi:thiol:disulfide interchange protein DsbD
LLASLGICTLKQALVPTKISFIKNPLLVIDGETKEKGKMISKYEKVFGVDVKYFNDTVHFVQTVKLKNNVKTSVSGTIEFMVCNDKQCLPPQTIAFSVKLE